MKNFDLEIKEAFQKQFYCSFSRNYDENEVLNGFIINLSNELILIDSYDSDFNNNGFELFYLKDISHYQIHKLDDESSFISLAVSKLNFKKSVIDIDLSSLLNAIKSISKIFPLLGIYEEEKYEYINIGLFVESVKEKIKLLELDSDADWYKDFSEYEINSISRITFGSNYYKALWLVGVEDLDEKLLELQQ